MAEEIYVGMFDPPRIYSWQSQQRSAGLVGSKEAPFFYYPPLNTLMCK